MGSAMEFLDTITFGLLGDIIDNDEDPGTPPSSVAPAAQKGVSAATVIKKRQKSKDSRRGEIEAGQAGDTSKVASFRGGTGRIRSSKGQEKTRLRAKKFKESRPLRVGMKRPK